MYDFRLNIDGFSGNYSKDKLLIPLLFIILKRKTILLCQCVYSIWIEQESFKRIINCKKNKIKRNVCNLEKRFTVWKIQYKKLQFVV